MREGAHFAKFHFNKCDHVSNITNTIDYNRVTGSDAQLGNGRDDGVQLST